MRQSLQFVTAVFVMAVFLTLGESKAKAGDREDAKALVGRWECTASLLGLQTGTKFEFKGDGTYYMNGVSLGTKWEVKGGMIVLHHLTGDTKDSFKLSPDENTLDWAGVRTLKRQK